MSFNDFLPSNNLKLNIRYYQSAEFFGKFKQF